MNAREKGSVLPVMAAIVTGIGLVVAGISVFVEEEEATRLETTASPKLERIAGSIVSYYKVAEALPCPANAEDATGWADCSLSDNEKMVVPWKTLGLADARDPWGQLISYRPYDELLTKTHDLQNMISSGKGLTICDDYDDTKSANCATPIKDTRAFVIFSHGRPRAASDNAGTVYGNGAYDAAGNPNLLPAHPAELANITTPPADGNLYYAGQRTPPSLMGGDPANDDPANAFEQIVLPKTLDDLNKSGTGGTEDDYDLDLNKDSQHDVFVTTPDSTGGDDEAQPAALGQRQGDGKNWVGIGNKNKEDRVGHMQNNRALCAWYPKPLKWEQGETMRGAFVFQFAPGESDMDEDQNFGGGFTLTFVPGPRRISWPSGAVACGLDNDNSDMGLGYKGGSLGLKNAYYDPDFQWDFMLGGAPAGLTTDDPLWMPKMAIEFDTYNNEYGDEDKLERNHVALLNAWDTDYIGNGNGNNPPCPDDGGSYYDASIEDPSAPRSGALARACTYDRDLRSWLEYVGEKKNKKEYTADWYVSNKGAAPYAARFEVARLCNSDCSTCGIAPPANYTTNTEYKTGRDNMWVRVWVEKVEDLATDKFLTALSDNLWDVEGYDLGNTPGKFINYCAKDPSMQFQDDDLNGDSYRRDKVMFDTIKVGITAAGKGGKGLGVSITDLRVKIAP